MREVFPIHRIDRIILLAVLLGSLWGATPTIAHEEADHAVRAVLFYSPSCPHCHIVMDEVIPPLEDEYGSALIIAEVDASEEQGNALYRAAVEIYEPEMVGVPMLIIDDRVLIGSAQIPSELPGLIDTYLEAGGLGWPDIPGIEDAVADLEPQLPAAGPEATLRERFTRDLAGNSLSVVVLLGLVVTWGAVLTPRQWQVKLANRVGTVAMLLVLAVGLVASIYLAYVETTGAEAVCGPIGDCNTVQQSEYALLFGFLPVAVLGLMGYVAILFVYVYGTWIQGAGDQYAPALVFLMAFFGLNFSIYLTFLEPFVIGATCAWCLTSAVSMALITLFSAGPGWPSLQLLLRDLGLKR
jgi:uncharacterized membrane protein